MTEDKNDVIIPQHNTKGKHYDKSVIPFLHHSTKHYHDFKTDPKLNTHYSVIKNMSLLISSQVNEKQHEQAFCDNFLNLFADTYVPNKGTKACKRC